MIDWFVDNENMLEINPALKVLQLRVHGTRINAARPLQVDINDGSLPGGVCCQQIIVYGKLFREFTNQRQVAVGENCY